MSARDVEVVQRIYDAFAGHRFPDELLAEGFTWTTHPGLPDAGTHRGRDAVRAFFADWIGGWAEVRNEPRELIDLGDRVVVLVRGRFRLTHDSEPFQRDYGHIWNVREGRASACEAVDLDEALALSGRRNVDLVRRLYEAFNAGDYPASLDLLTEDVEYHELEGMPGARGMVGVYRGREDLARWLGEFLGEWKPGFQSEPAEFMELDDSRVLVVEGWRGRGAQSEVDVEASAAALYTIRDGRIACIRYFSTKAEALEAAGPQE